MDDEGGELVAAGVESGGLWVLGGPVPALLRTLSEPGLLRFLEFFTVVKGGVKVSHLGGAKGDHLFAGLAVFL